jgi:hypothetical protein
VALATALFESSSEESSSFRSVSMSTAEAYRDEAPAAALPEEEVEDAAGRGSGRRAVTSSSLLLSLANKSPIVLMLHSLGRHVYVC